MFEFSALKLPQISRKSINSMEKKFFVAQCYQKHFPQTNYLIKKLT